jgi:hypothetical protein
VTSVPSHIYSFPFEVKIAMLFSFNQSSNYIFCNQDGSVKGGLSTKPFINPCQVKVANLLCHLEFDWFSFEQYLLYINRIGGNSQNFIFKHDLLTILAIHAYFNTRNLRP